jgi:hypothetical protein
MNALHVGLDAHPALPADSYLFIHDEVPKGIKFSRTFDPTKHSFNPLEGLTYRAARDLANVLYDLYPQGENTLTVRNGRRALLKALLAADRLDHVSGDEETDALIADILVSPLIKHVFCANRNTFPFPKDTAILARLNRAEIGDFDALVIGLILINHFKGQLVIPDFGFYGREAHIGLVREKRLSAGVHFLAELPPKLRRACLLMPAKVARGAIAEDARTLAEYAGQLPGTNAFNAFIDDAMSAS